MRSSGSDGAPARARRHGFGCVQRPAPCQPGARRIAGRRSARRQWWRDRAGSRRAQAGADPEPCDSDERRPLAGRAAAPASAAARLSRGDGRGPARRRLRCAARASGCWRSAAARARRCWRRRRGGRGARFVGVERDRGRAGSGAAATSRANGLESRVAVLDGDVAAGFARPGLPPFDAVHGQSAVLRRPGRAARRRARRGAAAWIARGGPGRLDRVMIWRRARWRRPDADPPRRPPGATSSAARRPRRGSIRIRPVHPFARRPGQARAGARQSRAAGRRSACSPPLVLHPRGGAKHTRRGRGDPARRGGA